MEVIVYMPMLETARLVLDSSTEPANYLKLHQQGRGVSTGRIAKRAIFWQSLVSFLLMVYSLSALHQYQGSCVSATCAVEPVPHVTPCPTA